MVHSPGYALLVGVDLYDQSFTSESTVLVEIAEAYFENEKSAESFEKGD